MLNELLSPSRSFFESHRMHPIKSMLRGVFNSLGYEIVRRPSSGSGSKCNDAPEYVIPADFSDEDRELFNFARPYTMTSPERVYALAQSLRYVVEHKIPGDVVECGVWRGGSMMVVARVLLQLGDADRHLYLFDTFEGMTAPTEKDAQILYEASAAELLVKAKKDVSTSLWCSSPLDEVRQNLSRTGYNVDRLHFVKGRVEETIPTHAPHAISLLRLDTDWYESTRHELVHLFPRLSAGGVLILDDYGWWKGARQATDEYLAQHHVKLLLNRIDATGGRIAVKP
jgi:O-methyltransferase